ncbi:MAG: hypothetical protein CME16_03545 [Gemmatimonadetes bacterium]|nr:hypothetical protein [Gemmatimonadota bacterium]
MTQSILLREETKVISALERHASRRKWLLWASAFCVLVSLITACPNYNFYAEQLIAPSGKKTTDFLQDKTNFERQIAHPLVPIHQLIQIDSDFDHIAKRGFRLVMPVIGHLFGLGLTGCLFLQHLMGFIFIFCVGSLGYEITGDRISAVFLMLAFSLVYLLNSFFYQLNIHFDGPAYLLMILAMLARGPWPISVAIFLAGFADERALIAFPLVFLWHLMRNNDLQEFSARSFFSWNSSAVGCAAGLLIHLLVRLSMMRWFDFRLPVGNQNGVGLERVRDQFSQAPVGIISPLEALWLLPVLALALLVLSKRHALLSVYSLAIAAVLIAGLSVVDTTRSMAYVFPAIFIAIKIVKSLDDDFFTSHFFFRIALVCFLIPSYSGSSGSHWLSPIFPKVLRWFFTG